MRLIAMIICLFFLSPAALAAGKSCVVILPDIGKYKNSSLAMMRNYMAKNGYDVLLLDFPDGDYTVSYLANGIVAPAIEKFCKNPLQSLHFITHGHGTLILRQYVFDHGSLRMGNVVVIEPPPISNLGERPLLWSHPAYWKFAYDLARSPEKRGSFDVSDGFYHNMGIITGDLPHTPFGYPPPDYKIDFSSRGQKVVAMYDHMEIKAESNFIVSNQEALKQALFFIENRRFFRPDDE